MRRLLVVATAVVGSLLAAGRRVRPGTYLGVGHPAGELRLELGRDGRFRLSLAIWDPVVGAVVGRREMAGRWRRSWAGLELESPTRHVDYLAAIDGRLVWRRSDLPTFADGITLARADATVARLTPVAADERPEHVGRLVVD